MATFLMIKKAKPRGGLSALMRYVTDRTQPGEHSRNRSSR